MIHRVKLGTSRFPVRLAYVVDCANGLVILDVSPFPMPDMVSDVRVEGDGFSSDWNLNEVIIEPSSMYQT
ncbi:MAG: hypothetical protein P9M15_04760, partial [Candidatus Electryoneaceae bacterium]|nr:hypothetical protein [Candidatus Electryoneaceae bacterium]